MDLSRLLTTTFIPSFFETIRSGLSALRALNPLKKFILTLDFDPSNIQFSIENKTSIKSKTFQLSFK